MLTNVLLRAKVLVLIGALLAAFGGVGAQAQQSGQDQNQRDPQRRGNDARQVAPGGQQGQQGQQGQTTPQAQQESDPFIHGISVGAGVAIYQGDFSRNPEHNPIKYIAGSGRLAIRAGVDHRLGRFDQFGLGADLVYNRLSGETTGGSGFSANSLALDFYGDYELPYIKDGLFRVFLGVGPNFVFSANYDNFDTIAQKSGLQGEVDQKSSRITGSLKVGVTILDKFRIGTRISSTDFLDGYEGFDPNPSSRDFVSFVNFSYRFDLKY